MKLSIVTTLYRSANYLEEFYERSVKAACQITNDYEIIFVNDGSPDHSLEVAVRLHNSDPDHVMVVDLSRNFGHHKAMMTGLTHAQGDYVFLIDCDLEEAPEILLQFYQTLVQEEVDVVFGVQEKRHDPILNRLASSLQYTLVNALASFPIPRNLMTVRLMSRRFVDHLLEFREQVFVISMLWEMTGFKTVGIPISKQYKGSSSYNFYRKLSYLVKTITTTSDRPLIYVAYLGLSIIVPAGLYIAFLLARYVFYGIGVDGWLSLIISLWFLSGLNFFILGIIGIYIATIFVEVKPRPYTIVRHVYQQNLLEAEKGKINA